MMEILARFREDWRQSRVKGVGNIAIEFSEGQRGQWNEWALKFATVFLSLSYCSGSKILE